MPTGTIMQEGSLRGRIQVQETLRGRIQVQKTLHGIVAIPNSVGSASWNEIADKPFSILDENTLFVENNILKVNTTDDAEADNTRPITSSGVHAICGNINALLQSI